LREKYIKLEEKSNELNAEDKELKKRNRFTTLPWTSWVGRLPCPVYHKGHRGLAQPFIGTPFHFIGKRYKNKQ